MARDSFTSLTTRCFFLLGIDGFPKFQLGLPKCCVVGLTLLQNTLHANPNDKKTHKKGLWALNLLIISLKACAIIGV